MRYTAQTFSTQPYWVEPLRPGADFLGGRPVMGAEGLGCYLLWDLPILWIDPYVRRTAAPYSRRSLMHQDSTAAPHD
jgi:hypothetical protein